MYLFYIDNISDSSGSLAILEKITHDHRIYKYIFFLVVYVLFLVPTILCWVKNVYDRHNLLKIEVLSKHYSTVSQFTEHTAIYSEEFRLSVDYHHHGKEVEVEAEPSEEQRQGCRARVLAKLRKQLYKPPLPSLFLTNARSIAHKMD